MFDFNGMKPVIFTFTSKMCKGGIKTRGKEDLEALATEAK